MRQRTPAELTGTLLAGRYRIGLPLARGGMGSVYEAQDERLGRPVAVKVLLPELSREEVYVERFRREATATAALAHPNIATTTDYGIDPGGLSFLVMERVDGPPLSTAMSREGTLSAERTVAIGRQVCAALEAAHAAGIVHRDLKPGNVLLVPLGDGRELVKLVDFGIAQLKASRAYARLTSTGALLGTPAFMSPEQARGETVDGRADVYALGVILYGCLTGKKAFDGPDTATIVQRILAGTHVPLAALRPDVPTALANGVETAIARDKAERFATARAFADALEESLGGSPRRVSGRAGEAPLPASLFAQVSAAAAPGMPFEPILPTAPPPAPRHVARVPRSAPVRRGTLVLGLAVAAVAVVVLVAVAVVGVLAAQSRLPGASAEGTPPGATLAVAPAPVAVAPVPRPLEYEPKTQPALEVDSGSALPTPAPPTPHHRHHHDDGSTGSTGWMTVTATNAGR